jgi:hypothetical protein
MLAAEAERRPDDHRHEELAHRGRELGPHRGA